MTIVITSGGLDSTTLLHYVVKTMTVKQPIRALTFNYGQHHVRELDCAHMQCAKLGVELLEFDMSNIAKYLHSALTRKDIPIPNINDVMGDPQPPTYVPNRNAMFLMIAAAFAESYGSNAVYYGAQKHDLYGYWDTTAEFLTAVNKLLMLNRKVSVEVKAPFLSYSKHDVLMLGLQLGVDFSKTWSCYRGEALACGTCPTCAERLKAFELAGFDDPLPYEKKEA